MYDVDQLDKVVQLDGIPRPDSGAPLPLIVADDHHLLLAYLISAPDPEWDGTYITLVSPDTDGRDVALIEFHLPSAHMHGPPNDEAFDGHPLASRGLAPYGVYEVKASSWIRRHERMNSVHPCHDRESFLATRRHFIFAFHDFTFECIARGLRSQTFHGSMRSAAQRLIELLAAPPLR